MSNRCTSRARFVKSAGSLRVSERLWHWKQRRGFGIYGRILQFKSVYCLRHHLELQDRRDYTPADRAARTCWLGCPGLLYYWRPGDAKSAFLLIPSITWPPPPRPHLTSPKVLKSSNPAPSARYRKQSVVSSYQK
ncbi:hypothetical protein TNCV_177551 [Trichonephila clavipes]|nr:hypothetical protein TNCV_177551 [Trichonephila clavipes]